MRKRRIPVSPAKVSDRVAGLPLHEDRLGEVEANQSEIAYVEKKAPVVEYVVLPQNLECREPNLMKDEEFRSEFAIEGEGPVETHFPKVMSSKSVEPWTPCRVLKKKFRCGRKNEN